MERLLHIPFSFTPQGQCYLWRPDVLWLNVVSDILIAISYFAIPYFLNRLLKNYNSFSQRWAIKMFCLFIFFGGINHLMSVITIWQPHYFLEGLLKAISATISITTTIFFALIVRSVLNEAKGDQDDERD